MVAVPDDDDDAVDVTDDVEDDDDYEVPRRSRKQAKPKKGKGKPKAPSFSPALAIVLAAGALLFGLFITIVILGSRSLRDAGGPALAGPSNLMPVESTAVPTFPDLGTPRILQPSGVRMWFVQMPPSSTPGHSMALRLYLPPTDAAQHTIPCVLVAPAGTNLLTGNDMDADDYHSETLPYAEAGMAVVFYSLDGGLADSQNASDAQYAAAYQKFRAAGAGVINGRNAMEFVLAKVPLVNPDLIFTAGHSSAGTVSLLMAAHEQRLAGSIAYAPCTDVEARLGSGLQGMAIQQLLPGVKDFLKQSSPKRHVDDIPGPVFLFHANDDSNVRVSESQAFAKQLEDAGAEVDFQTVPTGEHYQSMIDQGIPRAIQWLKKHVADYKKAMAE
jgi:dienelactone hydrolase